MRDLTDFELDLLKDASIRPIPVGGVLDETLEMLCNSFELLEQEYIGGEDYPLGAWIITQSGCEQLAKRAGSRMPDPDTPCGFTPLGAWVKPPETAAKRQRDEVAQAIHQHQDAIGHLQSQYTMDDPEFYALLMAYEALRVAWYVVKQGYDGDKLADLEMEIAKLKRELGMQPGASDDQ